MEAFKRTFTDLLFRGWLYILYNAVEAKTSCAVYSGKRASVNYIKTVYRAGNCEGLRMQPCPNLEAMIKRPSCSR